MNRRTSVPALLALALASPAWAQNSPAPLQPSTTTVVTPLEEPSAPVAGSREIAALHEELRALRLSMERAAAS